MESEQIRTGDRIVIAGSQAALSELVASLMSDDKIDRRAVDYDNPEIPGTLGEPVTIAILILVGVVGTSFAKGFATEAGKRSADAIWDKVAEWHKKHAASARFAIRDADNRDRPSDWDEVARIMRPKPSPRRWRWPWT